MKRFAWVAAVVLGLAITVPVAPAMAEDLDQGATNQLETAQGTDEQVVIQSADVTGDSGEATSGIDDTSVDEQGVAVVDETPEDEPSATGVESSDGNVVTEEAPNQASPGSTSEEDQMLEPMDAPDDTGSDSEAVSENTAYSIAPSATSDTLVGVAGNSASSGANVALSNPSSVLGNYWRFVSGDNGLWSIVNMRANMALTVNGTPASGSNVTVASGQGTKWVVQKNDDGTVSFIPFGYDSLRLDIVGESADAGANVRLYTASASSMQRFVLGVANALTEALANGEKLNEGVVVVNTALPGKRAIDIKSASKDNGANVQTYASNESLAQKFFLVDVGNGLYTLQSAVSGKYLDVAGGKTTSGTNVQQYTGNGTLAQLWYFLKTADGLWSLRNAKSGLALTVSGASSSNGANVDVEDANDDACQYFSVKYVNLVNKNQVLRLSPLGDSSLTVSTSGSAAVLSKTGSTADGWWRVDSASGNSITLASLFGAKKLAISGSVVSGAGATLVSGTGTTWIVKVNDGGSLTLSPKGYPGLALDVKNGKIGNGASLQIYKSNGTNAQRFLTPYSGNLSKAASTGMPVASCLHTIKSALGSNLVLDVKGSSKSNGANVQIYGSNSTNAQKWEMQYAGSGLYHIQSLNSKLYLGRAGSTSGSNVAQYKSSDELSQYWYLVQDGDGYVILNVTTGLALDVKSGKAANGSNVQLYTPNGSKAQRWVMEDTPLIKNGTYAFSSDLTVYGMLVLDVKSASKSSGANVQVYQSNGTDAQKWVLTYKGAGAYTLASKNSGLLLTVDGSSRSNGGNVVQKTNENSDYQRWIISLTDSGAYTFKNVGSGLMLDIKGGKSDNGVNVQQYKANGSAAQSWHIKTNHDPLPSNSKLAKFVSRMVYYTDIVNVGYDQLTPDRWTIKDGGECDCSSLVINCLREAGFNTGDVSSHIGKVNAGEPYAGCTYTGNMSYYLTSMKDDDGKSWSRLSFSLSKLKPGDILLNDEYHTCVVISGSGSTALIAQASIDENYYGWGGKAGDQTGYETNIKQAYVYSHGGWNCILRYNG